MMDLQEQPEQSLRTTNQSSAFLNANEVEDVFHNLQPVPAPPSPSTSLTSSLISSETHTTATSESQESDNQYELFFSSQSTPGPVYAASPQSDVQGIYPSRVLEA